MGTPSNHTAGTRDEASVSEDLRQGKDDCHLPHSPSLKEGFHKLTPMRSGSLRTGSPWPTRRARGMTRGGGRQLLAVVPHPLRANLPTRCVVLSVFPCLCTPEAALVRPIKGKSAFSRQWVCLPFLSRHPSGARPQGRVDPAVAGQDPPLGLAISWQAKRDSLGFVPPGCPVAHVFHAVLSWLHPRLSYTRWPSSRSWLAAPRMRVSAPPPPRDAWNMPALALPACLLPDGASRSPTRSSRSRKWGTRSFQRASSQDTVLPSHTNLNRLAGC